MEAPNTPDLKPATTLRDAKRRKQQAHVLELLGNARSVTEACAITEIARQTYYDWLSDDPEFARQVEQTRDTRASFIEGILYHAACRAVGDPKYIRAAVAYLQLHEQREKRLAQERRWEAEQRQREEAAQQAPSKQARPRVIRRRQAPPRPPKWVRFLVAELAPSLTPAQPHAPAPATPAQAPALAQPLPAS